EPEPLETAALQPDILEPVETVEAQEEAEPAPEAERPEAIEPLVDEVEVPEVETPEVVAMLPQPRPVVEDKPKEKPAPRKPKQAAKKVDKPERKEPVVKKTVQARPAPSEKSAKSSKASRAPSVSPA